METEDRLATTEKRLHNQEKRLRYHQVVGGVMTLCLTSKLSEGKRCLLSG